MKFHKQLFVALLLPGLLCAMAGLVVAQSADQNLPTPILSSEINGKVAPLDLGDPRVTRHFYAFEGTPGDLLFTIDSKNLNGDIDVFTAVTFRPLMKTTLFASSQSPEVTKGIYLRTHQILILRVEARTPNDEDGTYRVRFGGSFAPFSGGIPVAENSAPESEPERSTPGTKRLSSVGATIAQPVVETPPASAESKPPENAAEKPAEKTAEDTTSATKTTPAKSTKAKPTRTTARNSRGRAPRPTQPKPVATETETPKASEAKQSDAKTVETNKEAAGGGKSETDTTKGGTRAKGEPAPKPTTQETPLPSAHLIIESKDGTKIDRPMSTVRRVVVEGGMIVVVLKTGKIERIPMSAVARMAIEP